MNRTAFCGETVTFWDINESHLLGQLCVLMVKLKLLLVQKLLGFKSLQSQGHLTITSV